MEWLLAAAIATMVGAVAFTGIAAIVAARQSQSFRVDASGKSYQALVMELGPPTDREAFPDGTEVLCWRKYHEATTTLVMSGKVVVPIHHPAYTSGWKAILRNGRCLRMDEL